MHPSKEMSQPASTPGLLASTPRPDQRGASLVATVGDRDVFCLLRRLLIHAARRSAARRVAANIVTKQRFQTYLHDTAADVADGCSPAFLSVLNRRQTQYPFPPPLPLSSPSVFSDLLLDRSYKLFHILITRRIRSRRLFPLLPLSLS